MTTYVADRHRIRKRGDDHQIPIIAFCDNHTTAAEIVAALNAADGQATALSAIERAYRTSEHFRGGDLASHEIMDLLRRAITEEFSR